MAAIERLFLGFVMLLTLGAAVPLLTCVLDRAAVERLRHKESRTLQWINWDHRGSAWVMVSHGHWRLSAAQTSGWGRPLLEGEVTEIGRDDFLFDGPVRITDTPRGTDM